MPSVSKKQRNFMAAAAHSPAFAKKVGVPMSVAKEFNQADKGRKFKEGGEMKKNPFMEMIAKKKEAAAGKSAPAKKSGKPFAKGGMTCTTAAKKEVKTHEKKMHGMKSGGGVRGCGMASKGLTKGKMV